MIEVGEFARTTDGIIGIIENYDNGEYWIRHSDIDVWKCSEDYIVKHSKNIIDLIEVGDIIEINKGKYEVIYDKSLEQLGVLIPNRNHLAIRHSTLEHIFREYKNIRILTKEQYMQNCYTVERRENGD